MPLQETNSSSIDQGVDRKNLNIIRERFLRVNAARLSRTKSSLSARQEVFLDLLPLLFHVNHPILPGYVTRETPSGVFNYNPSKSDVLKAQRLARSFNYQRQPNHRPAITGLYLMGSCGTVAQSEKSDLDIWVCHQDDMNGNDTRLLRKKCDDISLWASSRGLEAHFFLMEGEKFRLGERESLSAEDCGSSQHYLLLDEFYRTGLLIAGRFPIWWLIPSDEDTNYDYYSKTLREKRFIREDESIDFGGVGYIPAGEFAGAGVWQLYKAIDSPYKSVLKILLTEVYASEYPKVEPLSTSFKKAIYKKQLDINELDPYVVVYRKLEDYLTKRNEPNRLELVRRCFYFKVGIALSRSGRNRGNSWKRELMEKLVIEWGWPKEHLYNLDARKKWKVGRVMEEQKELVRELTNCYRFVLEFARRTRASSMINSQEMNILGRKLYAAFERKAEKIEWINPGISPNLIEENLTFFIHQSKDKELSQWAVSSDRVDKNHLKRALILKKSNSLTSLLAWCHYNGLCDSSSRISVVEGEHTVREYEIFNMMYHMRQKLPVAKQYSDPEERQHERFNHAMRPIFVQLFINVGSDPLEHKRSQGIELISAHTDSLGYSGFRENLVINVEQVVVNSWGEISSHRYDGRNALMRCLKDFFQMSPPHKGGSLPQIDIHCFCPTRAVPISARVKELCTDITTCFYSESKSENARYVIEIGREFYVLQLNEKGLDVSHANNFGELLKYLGEPQTRYSSIVFDRYCRPNSTLQTLCQYAQPERIQVFFQQKDRLVDIFVLDELCSLHSVTTPFHSVTSLLNPLDQFIQSTLFRQRSESDDVVNMSTNNFPLQSRTVEYYEVTEKNGKKTVTRYNDFDEISAKHFFNLQATGTRNSDGNVLFDIYCDNTEFLAADFGVNIYRKAATHILNLRQSTTHYPCYITDLDLSRLIDESNGGPIQTIQYLRYKQQLELQIDKAIGDV
ncbi:MAG: adenylate cyclase class 1 [Oceanicoccus sp.]|jgi:adenylate cyclase class 1